MDSSYKFCPGCNIYSFQKLKNMINALFSLKTNGTKHFQRVGKPKFGWNTIDDLYQREVGRAQLSCARMVPRLKETHCLRDAWTKLNVLPAKIMQVNSGFIL